MLKAGLRAVVPASVWARLRALRRSWELRRFAVREVTHDYGGERLTVRLADPLAELWYDRDWDPLPELELLRGGRLRPGARVFDLGAHQALVALLLARAAGDTGSVVAVEASPHNAELAEINRALNGARTVSILRAAASDTLDPVRFADDFDGSIDDERGSVVVESVTVDELARRYGDPDVVFVDVEGAEARVLAGARQTLSRAGTDWYVEVHAGYGLERLGGTRNEIFDVFPLARYDVFVSFEHHGGYVPYTGETDLRNAAHALVALARP